MVNIRQAGRWFIRFITSADQRPFIKLTLSQLDKEISRAGTNKESFKLLGILDELTYRITSTAKRDNLKKRICDLILILEKEKINAKASRVEIEKFRKSLLKRYAEAAANAAQQRAIAERARLEAEAKARREAEEKARQEAEAERARLEAIAKAQREAEEQAKRVAEQERARLAAKQKQERLEAEARAQREAEEKARQEEDRRNQMKSVVGDIGARQKAAEEQKRIDKEERKRLIAEQIQNFMDARPLSPESSNREESKPIDKTKHISTRITKEAKRNADNKRQAALGTSEQNQQVKEEKQEPTAEEAKKTFTGETEHASKELRLEQNDIEPNGSHEQSYIGEEGDTSIANEQYDATSITQSREESPLQILESSSREEEREQRRELARIRKLERETEKTNQAEYDQAEAVLDEDIEQAEQFAPFLRAIPAHWSDWSEQHWNIKLLDYCFAQRAGENSSQGIPSTEEDLAFVTGDRETDPTEIARTLVDRVRELSFNRGLSPARLLIQRLETWDYKSPQPPRYFAFLWTTCLIAQGFPSPFEKGEFHRRYERDNVYGSNETQFLRGNLPAAWDQLSKWLERDDIFDAKGHRRLELPKVDPRRSVISHSWKLSFPCRSDRKRLHDVLGRYKKGHDNSVRIDLQLISYIYYQGDFTTEFTTALKQQIQLLKDENHLEEWFSAIIHREIEAQGKSQIQSASRGQTQGPIGMAPRLMLYLDDEDCYLELLLPSQSIPIEKQRRLSGKPYCTVTLEPDGRPPHVIGEFDIDDSHGELSIPDMRVKIDEEQDEYVLRLRHKGLDNGVLNEWSCEGLSKNSPCILFNSDTNEVLADKNLKGGSVSLLFRRDWDVILSDGIESESEDSISVSRLPRWRLLLLVKTSQFESHETISLVDSTGERLDICWVDSNGGRSKNRPIFRGLGFPGQPKGFIMLAESPELWLPPGITDVQIEIFRIEDDEFYKPIGSLQAPSIESWNKAGVRRLMTSQGIYSVRLSYFDNANAKTRKWTRDIVLVEEPDISRLDPTRLQARYTFREKAKSLDLERNVSPFVFQEPKEFWNAAWLILGLWPYEKIRVDLDSNGENYSQVLSATSSGNCEIPVSAFEPYLLIRESVRLTIQRQGFSCFYELALLNGAPTRGEPHPSIAQIPPTPESTKRKVPKRRLVDILEIVVYGERSYNTQDSLIAEVEEIINEDFPHLDRSAIEYPNSKRASGRRLVFNVMSFNGLDSEEKENLRVAIDSLVAAYMKKSSLDFRAEWSRRRE